MFPLNYALAAVLLSTPAESAEPAEAMDCLVTVRPAVRDLALSWEILDPREVRYVLTRSEDFPSDLKLLRRRYADLSDAPPLYDCDACFPLTRTLINDMLAFNRAYRQHLRQPPGRCPARPPPGSVHENAPRSGSALSDMGPGAGGVLRLLPITVRRRVP